MLRTMSEILAVLQEFKEDKDNVMHYFEKGNEVKRLYALMLALRMTSFEVLLRYKRYFLFVACAVSSLALYFLHGKTLRIPSLPEEAAGFWLFSRSPGSDDEALVRAFKLIQ